MTCLSSLRAQFISNKINDAIKNLQTRPLISSQSILNEDDIKANLPSIYSNSCNINALSQTLDKSSLAYHLLDAISKDNSHGNIDICSIFIHRILTIKHISYPHIALGLLYFVNKINLVQKEAFYQYIRDSDKKLSSFLLNYGQLYKTFIKLGQDINLVIPFFIKNADILLLRICIEIQSMYLFFLKNNHIFSYLNDQVRKEIILNTFFVCTELAKLLGEEELSDAIEDFGFCLIEPKGAKKIKMLLTENFKPCGNAFDEFLVDFKNTLLFNNINDFYIIFRLKRAHSVWMKMLLKGGDVRDVIGFRVVLNNVEDCYTVFNILKAKYSALIYKQKDFIYSPKSNGYQAIHVILSLKGVYKIDSFIEIQIKTASMEIASNTGKACHTLYKYKKLLLNAY